MRAVPCLVGLLVLVAGTGCSWAQLQLGMQDGPQSASVRETVSAFLEARIDGEGAERYLTAEARNAFNPEWVKTHVGLHPLYSRGGTAYESYRVVFVEHLDGGSYEVGYRLKTSSGAFGETLFVLAGDEKLRIVGGRLGLDGP